MAKPQPPYLYRVLSLDDTFELNDLGGEMVEQEKAKQITWERSCKIQSGLVRIRHEMEMGDVPVNAMQSLEALKKDVLETSDVDRRERDGIISGVVEDYLRTKSFLHFLHSGRLMPYSTVSHFANDEEYLAACMGMCQDLARYGMMVAINRDLNSIRQARDLCSDMLDHFLEYKFSNNYLKRCLTDAEYALKTLNTVMYDVTMTAQENESETSTFWPVKKRAKLESTLSSTGESATTIDHQQEQSNQIQLVEIRNRMEKRDRLLEKLIKYSSVVKKASRKAVHYLQKGCGGRAFGQMEICEKNILERIQPIVDQETPFKSRIYASTIEEYVKAKLFYAWMFGKEETLEDTESVLLKPKDFPLKLRPESYLIGLTGLPSEISRFAMQARTERNFDQMKHCLASCAAIAKAVLSLERCPSRIGKNFPSLKRSIGRLERHLYEMSLSASSEGQKIISETSVIGSSSLVPMLLQGGGDGQNPYGLGAAEITVRRSKEFSSAFPGFANSKSGINDIDDGSADGASSAEESGSRFDLVGDHVAASGGGGASSDSIHVTLKSDDDKQSSALLQQD